MGRFMLTGRWGEAFFGVVVDRWGGNDEWRMTGREENKEQERILAACADIVAGAVMKEKTSAHFARNDGRREGGRHGRRA
jgi:hypothetical protein